MTPEQEAANETADVFGEAFMKLVRERLRLKVSISKRLANDKKSSVTLDYMLVDACPVNGAKVIDSVPVTVEFNLFGELTAKLGY